MGHCRRQGRRTTEGGHGLRQLAAGFLDVRLEDPPFDVPGGAARDSLDALQVSLALQQRYGVRIEGAKDGRRILNSIASIAAFIRQKK